MRKKQYMLYLLYDEEGHVGAMPLNIVPVSGMDEILDVLFNSGYLRYLWPKEYWVVIEMDWEEFGKEYGTRDDLSVLQEHDTVIAAVPVPGVYLTEEQWSLIVNHAREGFADEPFQGLSKDAWDTILLVEEIEGVRLDEGEQSWPF